MLVSSLQQLGLILYLLHLYYRSFRLVSSLQSANSLFNNLFCQKLIPYLGFYLLYK